LDLCNQIEDLIQKTLDENNGEVVEMIDEEEITFQIDEIGKCALELFKRRAR